MNERRRPGWHLLLKWGLRFDFTGVDAGIGGKHLAKTGNPFIGRLDDFRIYNRALSAEEVRSLCRGSQ